MTTEIARTNGTELTPAILESALLGGDLERMPAKERIAFMLKVCESLGLNPLTKPFEFIKLNGKLVMYARKDCTEQLRKLNGVSVRIVGREVVDDVYVVTAQATDKVGRCDESIGAVPIKGLAGEAKANALMKAETKAKRRVTLSISGLGMLDETEVEQYAPAAPLPVVPMSKRLHGDEPKQLEAANDGPKASTGSAGAQTAQASAPSVSETPAATADSAPVDAEFEEPDNLLADEPALADLEEYADGEPIEQVECWEFKGDKNNAKWGRDTSKSEWVSIGMRDRRTDAQNRMLHVLKRDLGIEDDVWEERLTVNYNKKSSGDLSREEATILIDKLVSRRKRFGNAADKAAKQQRKLENGLELPPAAKEA